MELFNKFDKPVFLKEESDVSQFIRRLKELQSKAQGEAKTKIDREIKFATMGEIGEKNIAFELKNSGMPMYIMHDIHYEIDGLSAQIDYIVVTRKIAFVIECKNLIGNISVDNNGNFIRNYRFNGKYIKEGIYSPITQNERHLEIIKQVIKQSKNNILSKMLVNKYFDENYRSIVVLANPKTILDARYAKREIKNMVIRADQLNKYIKNSYQKSNNAKLNDKDMKKFAERLLSFHVPNKSVYVKKYEGIGSSMSDVSKKQSYEEKSNTKQVSRYKANSQQAYEDKITDLKYSCSKNEKQTVDVKSTCNQDKLVNKDELVKKLKEFRLHKSREEKIKPYYIFNNKQMMDLLSKMPTSKQELLDVSGFGEVKVNKYGDMILKILNK